jgi:hypothetical protein
MRLENLYLNFGKSTSEQQAEYIAIYRLRRATDLEKTPTSSKKKSSVTRSKIDLSLTDEEKAVMKMLGLKQKDILALRDAVGESEVEESGDLFKDSTFEEGEDEE